MFIRLMLEKHDALRQPADRAQLGPRVAEPHVASHDVVLLTN